MDLIDIDKVLDDLELNENGKDDKCSLSLDANKKDEQMNKNVASSLSHGNNITSSNQLNTRDDNIILDKSHDNDDDEEEKELLQMKNEANDDQHCAVADAADAVADDDDDDDRDAETSASSITTSSPSSFSSGLSPVSSNGTSSQISTPPDDDKIHETNNNNINDNDNDNDNSDRVKLVDVDNKIESESIESNVNDDQQQISCDNIDTMNVKIPPDDHDDEHDEHNVTINVNEFIESGSCLLKKHVSIECDTDTVVDTDTNTIKDNCNLEEIQTECDTKDEKEMIGDCVAIKNLTDIKLTRTEDCSSSDFSIDSAAESKEIPIEDIQTIENMNIERPATLDLTHVNTPQVISQSNAGQTPPAKTQSQDVEINDNDNQQQQQQQQQQTNHTDIINTELGKIPPVWVPDSQAPNCMQCNQKFSIIKRRHHCRACGRVLCGTCCSQKGKLEFLDKPQARICNECHHILITNFGYEENSRKDNEKDDSKSDSVMNSRTPPPPNPNNPMEYCSVIPPQNQVGATSLEPMSVIVPVGVLKRRGITKTSKRLKSVTFSDGIKPGCDISELYGNDNNSIISQIINNNNSKKEKNYDICKPLHIEGIVNMIPNGENNSYIPKEHDALPPIHVGDITSGSYTQIKNGPGLITKLQNETLKFLIRNSFYVLVRIRKLKCCINRTVINFTTLGMRNVGQDEIVILLHIGDSDIIPKDIFIHLNDIYCGADNGFPINELGFSIPKSQEFLSSREHGGFLYIRQTFQCLQEICVPESPFLIGVLIHRWEVPWAKIFPLRLMLRLGAQYRYYPSPHVSFRNRESVYAEIGQTIINFLADFRNFSFTIATIKGMFIHMEDRKTTVLIPRNRHELVIKALNNSTDYILALGASFSKKADGHLVCMQNMNSDCPDSYTYSTQSINIQGQPRKITGASFLVLNGALKTTSGLSGKCSIVEDGIMVQILPSKMVAVRTALKDMKDIEIVCGPVEGDESHKEIVAIQWTENDLEFNIGVVSPIDEKKMDGIPSIRILSRTSFADEYHIVRWTEVFIIQINRQIEEESFGKNSSDVLKLAEQIAKATCAVLGPLLMILVANGMIKIGLRTTIHPDNVCYKIGSEYNDLSRALSKDLDNELIPLLHKEASNWDVDNPLILELIFCILDK